MKAACNQLNSLNPTKPNSTQLNPTQPNSTQLNTHTTDMCLRPDAFVTLPTRSDALPTYYDTPRCLPDLPNTPDVFRRLSGTLRRHSCAFRHVPIPRAQMKIRFEICQKVVQLNYDVDRGLVTYSRAFKSLQMQGLSSYFDDIKAKIGSHFFVPVTALLKSLNNCGNIRKIIDISHNPVNVVNARLLLLAFKQLIDANFVMPSEGIQVDVPLDQLKVARLESSQDYFTDQEMQDLLRFGNQDKNQTEASESTSTTTAGGGPVTTTTSAVSTTTLSSTHLVQPAPPQTSEIIPINNILDRLDKDNQIKALELIIKATKERDCEMKRIEEDHKTKRKSIEEETKRFCTEELTKQEQEKTKRFCTEELTKQEQEKTKRFCTEELTKQEQEKTKQQEEKTKQAKYTSRNAKRKRNIHEEESDDDKTNSFEGEPPQYARIAPRQLRRIGGEEIQLEGIGMGGNCIESFLETNDDNLKNHLHKSILRSISTFVRGCSQADLQKHLTKSYQLIKQSSLDYANALVVASSFVNTEVKVTTKFKRFSVPQSFVATLDNIGMLLIHRKKSTLNKKFSLHVKFFAL